MKRIACTNSQVATRVRAILARFGILRGVYHIGPDTLHPTIQLVVCVTVDPTRELTMRCEIETIAGARIQD